MIKFGVIGYGYWGPNIVRNLATSSRQKSLPSATRTKSPKGAPSRRTLAYTSRLTRQKC